jgi:hypothetical protein
MRRIHACALFALMGCAGLHSDLADTSKRDVGTECASTAECPATTTCVRGRCEYDGKVVSPQPPSPKPAGATCVTDADCNSGELCVARACEPKDLFHQ